MHTKRLTLNAGWIFVGLATLGPLSSCKEAKTAAEAEAAAQAAAKQKMETTAALKKAEAEAEELRKKVQDLQLKQKNQDFRIQTTEVQLTEAKQKLATVDAQLQDNKRKADGLEADALATPLADTAPSMAEIMPPQLHTPAAPEVSAPVFPQDSLSQDYFVDELSPYGSWLATDEYGYVWFPNTAAEATWHPYLAGRWLDTDWGWAWHSYEPHGWATCHYGRWGRCERRGWFWTPGNTWAPAWVAFRSGPQCVGWAPLPPETLYAGSVGKQVESDYRLNQAHFCFVGAQQFGASDLRTHACLHAAAKPHYHSSKSVCSVVVSPDKVKCLGPARDWVSANCSNTICPPKCQISFQPAAHAPKQPAVQLAGGKLLLQQPKWRDEALTLLKSSHAALQSLEKDSLSTPLAEHPTSQQAIFYKQTRYNRTHPPQYPTQAQAQAQAQQPPIEQPAPAMAPPLQLPTAAAPVAAAGWPASSQTNQTLANLAGRRTVASSGQATVGLQNQGYTEHTATVNDSSAGAYASQTHAPSIGAGNPLATAPAHNQPFRGQQVMAPSQAQIQSQQALQLMQVQQQVAGGKLSQTQALQELMQRPNSSPLELLEARRAQELAFAAAKQKAEAEAEAKRAKEEQMAWEREHGVPERIARINPNSPQGQGNPLGTPRGESQARASVSSSPAPISAAPAAVRAPAPAPSPPPAAPAVSQSPSSSSVSETESGFMKGAQGGRGLR